MEIPVLGQSAARARQAQAQQEQQVPDEEDALIEAETGVLVLQFADGEVLVSPDLNIEVSPRREASGHDLIGMAHAVATQEDPVFARQSGKTAEGTVITAFLLYRLPDGQVLGNTDLDAPVTVEREPHLHDIIGMAHAMATDVDVMLHAQYIANAVVGTQQAAARAAMQQMQAAQVKAQLEAERKKNGG